MQLKDYVQDLINRKEITLGAQASPNVGLLIFQNVFPPYNNKNASKTPIQHNNTNNNRTNNAQLKQGENRDKSQNYTLTYLDYGNLIRCISNDESFVNVLNIKGPNNQCTVTNRRTRINITGPPALALAPSTTQYNILEHLGNMPT